jgi:hypothetical protein
MISPAAEITARWAFGLFGGLFFLGSSTNQAEADQDCNASGQPQRLTSGDG